MATGPQHQKEHSNIALNCIQINLKHSKTGTEYFKHYMKEEGIDIASIQEPYNYLNQVKGNPRNYKLFTSGKARKRVVIVNKKIDAILLDQLSDEDTALVEITYGNLRFIATSI